MAIISINYTDIVAKKETNAKKGQVSIKNNISIANVTLADVSASPGQKAVVFEYKFAMEYAPEFGLISITGNVVELTDEKTAKDLVEMWDKNKRVDKVLTKNIFSVVYDKCIIKAIALSQDVALPPPVQLPKVKMNEEPVKAAKTKK